MDARRKRSKKIVAIEAPGRGVDADRQRLLEDRSGKAPKEPPAPNLDNLRAMGKIPAERPAPRAKAPKIAYLSSSSDTSEEVWDIARILQESPSTEIVREFIRANVECIADPDEDEILRG